MKFAHLHDWDVSYQEAQRIQQALAPRVKLVPLPRNICLVAGVDVAFSKADDLFFAVVVVLALPELDLVEQQSARTRCRFPYVPGLLSFREGPIVLSALRKLRHRPDVVLLDGQGLAHPRRLGLASHIGLWLGLPTVGCAKSRLIGEHEEPGRRKGDWTPLMDAAEVIGSVLRTRHGVKPLYVSPGHLCDHEGARRITLECCRRCRMPEPTRRAHLTVGALKRALLGGR